MTYEEKKAWLKRYRQALAEEAVLAAELEQLRAQAERVTPVLTGMPGGTTNNNQIPQAVERIVQVQEQLNEQMEQAALIRKEIAEMIEQIPARAREILHRRYILGQRWERISEEMYMDKRWLTRQHRIILENLDFTKYAL